MRSAKLKKFPLRGLMTWLRTADQVPAMMPCVTLSGQSFGLARCSFAAGTSNICGWCIQPSNSGSGQGSLLCCFILPGCSALPSCAPIKWDISGSCSGWWVGHQPLLPHRRPPALLRKRGRAHTDFWKGSSTRLDSNRWREVHRGVITGPLDPTPVKLNRSV